MVVVLMFILSWLPLHLHSAITHFIPEVRIFSDELQLNSYVISFFACHWLAMAHSCVDPIIYSFMSSSFRVSGRQRLRRCNAMKCLQCLELCSLMRSPFFYRRSLFTCAARNSVLSTFAPPFEETILPRCSLLTIKVFAQRNVQLMSVSEQYGHMGTAPGTSPVDYSDCRYRSATCHPSGKSRERSLPTASSSSLLRDRET